MPTGWVLLQDEYRLNRCHSINMAVNLLPLNLACLPALCFSIRHTCWYGVSLTVLPAGVVPHYQQCMLVWCLTIGHVFWCCASLNVMSVVVVPHLRQYLLVRYHCNWYFTSRVQMVEGWFPVWCYMHLYRGTITSDMSVDHEPLSDMTACRVQLYQTYVLGSFIQIRVFLKCFSIRHGIWSITNPSDMPTGKVPILGVCRTCLLPF